MSNTPRLTYAQVTGPKALRKISSPLLEQERNTADPRSNVSARPVTANTVDKNGQEKGLTENVTARTARERRPSQKIVAARTVQEEAARRQELLEENRAERVKRSQRKKNKENGVDRPAESGDEERPDAVFTSQTVVTKVNAQKLALIQRQNKVPPPAPAWVRRSESLAFQAAPAEHGAAPRQSSSHRKSTSPTRHVSRSRHHLQSPSHSRSPSRSRSRSHSRQRGRHMPPSPYQDDDFEMHEPGERRSRSISPAISLNTHGKRGRSDHDDAVDEIASTFIKAQKVTEGGGRPKASDYDEVAKEVILAATAIYRCLVSTQNSFPTPSEEAELTRLAWDRANTDTAQDVPIAISPLIAKVITARGSQIRSEVKARAVTYVETLYGFESGRGKSIIKQNRERAEELKRDHAGFLYKNLAKESGLYQHPIIQKIVNKSWFNNSRDEGIVFVDLFDPLSVEAIALVLTAIECAIDGWATGLKVDISFYGSEYKSIYIRHVKTLQAFGVATSKHDLLGKLQRSLFNYGRIHAGVSSTLTQSTGLMLPQSAFAAALKEYEEDSETEEDGEDVD